MYTGEFNEGNDSILRSSRKKTGVCKKCGEAVQYEYSGLQIFYCDECLSEFHTFVKLEVSPTRR